MTWTFWIPHMVTLEILAEAADSQVMGHNPH